MSYSCTEYWTVFLRKQLFPLIIIIYDMDQLMNEIKYFSYIVSGCTDMNQPFNNI